ncbi:MAG: hypothetical protein KDD40_10640, partial [Bdellovibrionales bacterium]|nr:hypothetical protein [Bdellovibrionales bacterium]
YNGVLSFFSLWKSTYFNATPFQQMKLGSRGQSLVMADLNGDNFMDYVVADIKSHKLIVLYAKNP